MAILPSSDIERVQFIESHISAWQLNSLLIGLTAAQVTAIDTAAKAARTAFNAQQAAKNAAKGATQTFHNNADNMTDLARIAITNIKNKAESSNDPNVYTLAQIPPPAVPAPVGVPDAPTNTVADPNADGSVTVTWKGSNANQTFFTVWRRTGGANPTGWASLGATAFKTFTDATVPGGVPSVEYRVTAQRQNFISTPGTAVMVTFGAGGGGGFATSNETAGFVGPENNAASEAA